MKKAASLWKVTETHTFIEKEISCDFMLMLHHGFVSKLFIYMVIAPVFNDREQRIQIYMN